MFSKLKHKHTNRKWNAMAFLYLFWTGEEEKICLHKKPSENFPFKCSRELAVHLYSAKKVTLLKLLKHLYLGFL